MRRASSDGGVVGGGGSACVPAVKERSLGFMLAQSMCSKAVLRPHCFSCNGYEARLQRSLTDCHQFDILQPPWLLGGPSAIRSTKAPPRVRHVARRHGGILSRLAVRRVRAPGREDAAHGRNEDRSICLRGDVA